MLCSVNSRMHVFLLQFINSEIETNPTIRAILQLLWVWIEKLSSCRKDLCLLLPFTGGTINLSPCTLYSLSRSFWTALVNSYFSDLHKHCLLWFQFPGDMFSPHPSSEGWMLYKHYLLMVPVPRGHVSPPPSSVVKVETSRLSCCHFPWYTCLLYSGCSLLGPCCIWSVLLNSFINVHRITRL